MSRLATFFSQIEASYHRAQYLSSDPIEFVHRFSDPWDQEATALLASVLAYGKVAQIRNSLEQALKRIQTLSDSPKTFVKSLSDARFRKKALGAFADYTHRFNRGEDVIQLFELLHLSWKNHGSLGSHFLKGLAPEAPTIESALNQLITEWKQTRLAPPVGESFSYLLTAPQDGSCCKRWCMLLRWMGRKDEVDLGLWMKGSPLAHTFPLSRGIEPRQLVMPLDTHTGRLSQKLGFTQRKSLNWKAALEVTESFRGFDPQDPTRYDFALSRIGMFGEDVLTHQAPRSSSRFPSYSTTGRGH